MEMCDGADIVGHGAMHVRQTTIAGLYIFLDFCFSYVCILKIYL